MANGFIPFFLCGFMSTKIPMNMYANNFETVAIFCACKEQDAIDALGWIREFGNWKEEDEILQAIELINYNTILV